MYFCYQGFMKQTAGIIFRSVILVLAGMAIGLLINSRRFADDEGLVSTTNSNKLDRVMQLVRKKYVDSINVDSVEGVTIKRKTGRRLRRHWY
jgi:carboxyl-terminal processing protease